MRLRLLGISLILFTLLLTASWTTTRAQETFEGKLSYRMAMGNGSQDIAISFKGNLMRMDYTVRGQEAALLYFPEKQESIILLETAKSFMKIDQSNIDTTQMDTYNADIYHQMEETGETETINGRECTVWRAEKEDKSALEACLTDRFDGQKIPELPDAGMPAGPDWNNYPKGQMPLEVREIDKDGNNTVLFTLTGFEIRALDDSLFTIPDGYRDLSGMMNNRN